LAGVRHFARGRYALKAAYALCGVGPDGALLAPAYHCRTMLDPAVRLRANVILYPLSAGLEPDLPALRRLVQSAGTPVRALLFTHYFGIPRDIAPVAAMCGELGISLIEDCSHALVPNVEAAAAIGRTGRYAVSSPYKFFPCPDGGLLWSNGGAELPPEGTKPASVKDELRGLRNALGGLLARPHPPDPQAVDRELAALSSKLATRAREWVGDADGLSGEYAAAAETCSSLRISRWISRHVDVAFLAARRRQRYAQWAAAVADLPGCRALFPALPDGCVPYMFALRVQRPEACFYALKHLGLPIWRWDDMAVSDCAVAQEYRQGVFHLPCHQSLSDAQMQWMIRVLRRVVLGR
jgi:dTDP-4-amino-4,6-dideoxygalactose transaminase